MRYVVFDFDGPIFDGRKAAIAALEETVSNFESSFQRPNLSFKALALFGPTRLISLLYSELELADRESVHTFYRERLQKIEQQLEISETVHKALSSLRNAGFPLAIYSARPTEELKSLLSAKAIASCFKSVGGRPEFTKPSGDYFRHLAETERIPLSEMLYVGDSDWDYDAAEDGKVQYYHAGWTDEPNTIAVKKPHLILSSLEELVSLLRFDQTQAGYRGDVPEKTLDVVRNKQFSFYAGAGISVPSGIEAWERHYRRVLTELSAGFLAKDSELPEVLQWLAANPSRARGVFDAFRNSFNSQDLVPNDYHFAMLRSRVDRIWTSNYDDLFEKAMTLGQFGKTQVIRDDRELLDNPDAAHLVIKMNGDFSAARFNENLNWGLVFLQEQFDRAQEDRRELWSLFEDDYRQRSIIFVGLSFRDPVLRRILALARQKITRTRYDHYLLAKRETNIEARVKQAMLAESLRRASIITVFRDSFEEILDLVQQIALAAYGPIVGFSGDVGRVSNEESARDVVQEGMTITAGEVARVCGDLAAQLARRKVRITSGGAPFVGKPAVEAAFSVDSKLARFYLRKHGGSAYRATAPAVVVPGGDYESMRQRFIPELSALVAVGGRPDPSGKSGTIAEVEMAMDRNIPVLLLAPVGGDVLANYERLLTRMDNAYTDEVLRRSVVELNRQIAAVEPSRLSEFVRDNLPQAVEKMLRVLMGAGITLRHGEEGRDW